MQPGFSCVSYVIRKRIMYLMAGNRDRKKKKRRNSNEEIYRNYNLLCSFHVCTYTSRHNVFFFYHFTIKRQKYHLLLSEESLPVKAIKVFLVGDVMAGKPTIMVFLVGEVMAGKTTITVFLVGDVMAGKTTITVFLVGDVMAGKTTITVFLVGEVMAGKTTITVFLIGDVMAGKNISCCSWLET